MAHQEVDEEAFNLVVSKNKDVFGLDKDTDGKAMDAKLKAEYGNTTVGRGCLLARKMVEAGASCVVVNSGFGWDMHANIAAGLTRQLPGSTTRFPR